MDGGEQAREMAYRFGINLVMYILTGNYKEDQVHIPDLLERLGTSRDRADWTMMEASRLGFDPLIPWLALWVLVGGAVVLWGVYVCLRGKAWLFRALALTVLALALANPLWIEEQREPLKDIVAVVMDRSESMNFRGRTETAQAAYDAIRSEIEADETLELRIAETDPGADGTDMYIALQSALSDAPRERIAGAVMITDGQIHDIPEDTPRTPQQLGPVHAMIVGGDDEIDRNIEIQSAPSFSIIDQKRRDARAGERPDRADRARSASPSMARRSRTRRQGRRAADDLASRCSGAARTLSCCRSTASRTS